MKTEPIARLRMTARSRRREEERKGFVFMIVVGAQRDEKSS
jgi:hypothetical protein